MIRDIFIPQEIRGYYPLPKRILGIDINKTHIQATQLVLKGYAITIEKYVREQLDPDTAVPYEERIAKALTSLARKVDRIDEVRSALTSNAIIFKELNLPFTEPEKISAVLKFEVEPFLPFPPTQAIIDYVITSTDIQNKSCTIFTAAVQKSTVEQHLAYYKGTPFEPQVITVDIFDLYGLYKSIPVYQNMHTTHALVDIATDTTRIAIIADGQLKLVRIVPQGIGSVAKEIAQKLQSSPATALEDLMRFGLEKYDDHGYAQAVETGLNTLWQTIEFTFAAYNSKAEKPLQEVILLGHITDIPHITAFISRISTRKCSIFNVADLVHNPHISSVHKDGIPLAFALSLATALPSQVTQNFNLRQQELRPPTTVRINAQVFTAAGLIVLIILTLLVSNWWHVRNLAATLRRSQHEVITYLQEQGLAQEDELDDALQEATTKVEKEEDIWFAFSNQMRFSFLKYLQDLSTALDRQSLGLNLKKMTINASTITLDGSVKDYPALNIFMRELQNSKLFINDAIPQLQETTFTNLKLPLKKNGGAS